MSSPESRRIRKSIHKESGDDSTPIEEQRRGWRDYAESLPIHPAVTTSEETIECIPCLWLEPSDSPFTTTVLYFHGGGLVDGSIITHRSFLSKLAAVSGCRFLLPEFRLMPEHPFPAALEDMLTIYRELLTSKRILPERISFGGDSAGSALAFATIMKARDCDLPLPDSAFSISGCFDLTLSSPSIDQLESLDPGHSRAAMQNWIDRFIDHDLADPFLSPIFGDTTNFPSTLLIAGEHEIWRDDSFRMAEKLKSTGSQASVKTWPEMWHVWPMYDSLPEADEAITHISKFLKASQLQP